MRKLMPKLHPGQPGQGTDGAAPPPGSSKRKRSQVSRAGGARSRLVGAPLPAYGLHDDESVTRECRECDNQRPACSPCLHSASPCRFATTEDSVQRDVLEKKLQVASQTDNNFRTILNLLHSSSHDESTRLLDRIRQAPSLDDFMKAITDASLLVAPGMRAQTPTPPSELLSPVGSAICHLPPRAVQLAFYTYKTPSFGFWKRRQTDWINNSQEHLTITDALVAKFPRGVLPVAKWTDLSNDNRYLTHLLNLFFTWDHTLSHVIDRGMFLEHLMLEATEGLEFCSRFLVHSILAISHLYASQSESPRLSRDLCLRGRDFAKAALELLQVGRGTPSITLLQGLAMLWMYEANYGDKIRAEALQDELCGVHETLGLSHLEMTPRPDTSDRHWQALSFIVWGFFCLEAKISVTFSRAMRIRKPKITRTFDFANSSVLANPEAPEYFWSPYPDKSSQTQASFFREVIRSKCRLAELVQEASPLFLLSEPESPMPSYDEAMVIYEKLLSWNADANQRHLSNTGLLPAISFLDITYEMVVLKILSCLCRFPSRDIAGETAASTRATYGSSIISNLWLYRVAYGLRHEYWLMQACFSASTSVVYNLGNNSTLPKAFFRSCQLLYEMGEYLPVANECLLVIKTLVHCYAIDLPKACSIIFVKLGVRTGRTTVQGVKLLPLETDMTVPEATPSYAGVAVNISPRNTFDWLFSNPFERESEYTPKQQTVPRIPDDQPIFVDHESDRALTYSQLRNDALAFAAGLQALGLDAEDLQTLPPTPTCVRPEVAPVVLIQLPNCLPFATAFMGTLASGLTSTLISPALKTKEIAWVLQNARPRVIITAKPFMEAMQQALLAQDDQAYFSRIPVYSVDLAGDTYPLPHDEVSVEDWRALLLTATPRSVHTASRFSPEQALTRTAVILWSSGTSGRSKGVLLSHHALNFSAASLWHDADFYGRQPQRWLGYVPFFHVFGLTNAFLLAVSTGSTVYTMPTFKLDAVLAAIPERKITYLHMAPPVAVILAKSPAVEPFASRDSSGRNAFDSVVGGVTGGAPLGHEIVAQVYRRLGFLVRMGYGLSEACSVTVQRGLGEEDMRAFRNDTGRPHWGVELMIVADGNNWEDKITTAAPVGSSGEVLVRSPALMSAYIPSQGLNWGSSPNMSATTESLTPDGWLRTGDVGNLDINGILVITDRIKELIKVRAFQVAPAELEALLCSSAAVADAGVVGIYDSSEATEWPVAYVVAADKTSSPQRLEALGLELKALVEEHTARYKWLVGGVVFVEEIPKSPSGKILRRVMKEGGVKGYEVKLYQRRKRHEKL
ncbi:hypothetical protein G7046_g820 [Stylonectria norvegica]|nr:hypothetical protein G7046_g820 [Stylonectria norvegica]